MEDALNFSLHFSSATQTQDRNCVSLGFTSGVISNFPEIELVKIEGVLIQARASCSSEEKQFVNSTLMVSFISPSHWRQCNRVPVN